MILFSYQKLLNLISTKTSDNLFLQLLKMIPDAKDEIEREIGKYRVFRFARLIGFKPSYLYNPRLR